jgi:hypothetical protein
VIPRAYITHWSTGAPWPCAQQVEQDLILSQLIVEIANRELQVPPGEAVIDVLAASHAYALGRTSHRAAMRCDAR